MSTRKKITIIGVGLLGGSIALALRKDPGIRLVGWNHRAASRRKAAKLLEVAPSFEKAVEGADLVVLCAHSGSIGAELNQMRTLIKKDTLVLDVSSVKGAVIREAARIPGMADHFVPCHPMAGKEKSGPAQADGDLYRGKVVFITPMRGTPEKQIHRAATFWKKLGAVTVRADSTAHDRGVALTSHLPHLLACLLMETYGLHQGKSPIFPKAVGSGFRDFTRIAGGSPAMWRDIVEMNAEEIKPFLSQYRKRLGELETKLGKGKGDFWFSFFEKARALREKL